MVGLHVAETVDSQQIEGASAQPSGELVILVAANCSQSGERRHVLDRGVRVCWFEETDLPFGEVLLS